jgi:hypothetical protein
VRANNGGLCGGVQGAGGPGNSNNGGCPCLLVIEQHGHVRVNQATRGRTRLHGCWSRSSQQARVEGGGIIASGAKRVSVHQFSVWQ